MRFAGLALLMVVIAVALLGTGSHLGALWQPFEAMLVFATYGAFYLSIVGRKLPKPSNYGQVWSAGQAAFWPSIIMPTALGLIHSAAYLDRPIGVLGTLMGASMTVPVYSVLTLVWFASYQR